MHTDNWYVYSHPKSPSFCCRNKFNFYIVQISMARANVIVHPPTVCPSHVNAGTQLSINKYNIHGQFTFTLFASSRDGDPRTFTNHQVRGYRGSLVLTQVSSLAQG